MCDYKTAPGLLTRAVLTRKQASKEAAARTRREGNDAMMTQFINAYNEHRYNTTFLITC